MGIKKPKGAISVENFKSRIRLRWRFQGKRYSLSLSNYSKLNLLEAQKIALQIEQDIIVGSFDFTLVKYGSRKKEHGTLSQIPETFVAQFEWWVKQYKHMDCEVHTNYNFFRNMIRKWGNVKEGNVLKRMNEETFCATIGALLIFDTPNGKTACRRVSVYMYRIVFGKKPAKIV